MVIAGVIVNDRGGGFYDDPDVHACYTARSAPDRFNPNHVMEEPAILAEVGDPTGLRVIDLGCGDGRFGRELLEAGCASYHGVDGSTRMVEVARRNLAGTSARVERVDMEDFESDARPTDLVTARLSLHYIADLDAVLRSAARSLVPGGRVVFSVLHPVITSHRTVNDGQRMTWTVDDYFHPGPRRRQWMGSVVTWQHRTVENYVHAMIRAGFCRTALRECEPVIDRFDGDGDELARRRRVPLFLLLSGRMS